MAPTNSSSINDNRRQDKNDRKSKSVISLDNFAQRKGHVRALEEFHKRKTKKRVETAKALRNYRKVMKQEGYDAGHGASRKRRPKRQQDQEEFDNDSFFDEKEHEDQVDDMDPKKRKIEEESDDDNDSDGKSDDVQEKKQEGRHQQDTKAPLRKKAKKINPFQKSLKQAEDKKSKAKQKEMQMKQNDLDRKQKLKQRKVQSKLLAKRTKRGQPIIKNIADNLLLKLQKQNQQPQK